MACLIRKVEFKSHKGKSLRKGSGKINGDNIENFTGRALMHTCLVRSRGDRLAANVVPVTEYLVFVIASERVRPLIWRSIRSYYFKFDQNLFKKRRFFPFKRVFHDGKLVILIKHSKTLPGAA